VASARVDRAEAETVAATVAAVATILDPPQPACQALTRANKPGER